MAAGAPLSLRYHSDQLGQKVSTSLQEFFETGEFCDIVLIVGSAKIRAHRVVLASFSPYFRYTSITLLTLVLIQKGVLILKGPKRKILYLSN